MVEVLIVIVVIAILASLTVVSYRTAQTKAYNTETISAADTFSKLLTLHYDLHGPIKLQPSWIHGGSYGGICLGNANNYPKIPQLEKGECWNNYWTVPQLSSALAKVGDAEGQSFSFDSGSSQYSRGVQYKDGMLMYDLRGKDQDCVVRDSEVMNDPDNTKSTDCAVNLGRVLGGDPIEIAP